MDLRPPARCRGDPSRCNRRLACRQTNQYSRSIVNVEQDRRGIYVYDLAVLKGHRRKGVATRLIEESKRVAAERDVYVIFIQADLVNAPAIALYESLGAKETVHHIDIVVVQNPGRSIR
jgi:ribosomal protein S18 acetylase RimI-like enzyme